KPKTAVNRTTSKSTPKAAPDANQATVSTTQRLEFAIPDLGEGIAGGKVVNVLAQPGDRVAADQPLIELETEKATIPIPSPGPAELAELRVKQGQDVKVGEVIAVVNIEAGAAPPSQKQVEAPAAKAAAIAAPAAKAVPLTPSPIRNGANGVP